MAEVKFLKDHPDIPQFKKGKLAKIDNASAQRLAEEGYVKILPKKGLRVHHAEMQRSPQNKMVNAPVNQGCPKATEVINFFIQNSYPS